MRRSIDEEILLDNQGSFPQSRRTADIESGSSFFDNDTVDSFSWSDIRVSVKSRKEEKHILQGCEGYVSAGQVLALMGPSGSGKTTLLNVLANRSQLRHSGNVLVNGKKLERSTVRQISSYLEQEDVNIGGLTVGESINFTIQLASPELNRSERWQRCGQVLRSLGLSEQRDTIISSPFRKGISGGQKRRLSLGTALVTGPKLLFLDEPTSGLDSTTSYEVMSLISRLAKRHRLLVIASIHQPSKSTFELFDSVLLLSKGHTCYFGPRNQVSRYFTTVHPLPIDINPAESMLELVNTDFEKVNGSTTSLQELVETWSVYDKSQLDIDHVKFPSSERPIKPVRPKALTAFATVKTLVQRNFIKSYRDPLVYGTRLILTTLLSVVIGTVWYRLPYTQSSIQPWINCLFFVSAFTSLMGVAYVPSIIEDIRMLQKEYSNRLYGPTAFTIANFLLGLPWLFFIALSFSLVVYWLANLYSTPDGFAYFASWIFFNLLASESLVVIVSSLAPQFVTSLAIIALLNGLWLAVGGFLVPVNIMNDFWKCKSSLTMTLLLSHLILIIAIDGFHYIDYQTYTFQGMMLNQFKNTTYSCATVPSPAGTNRTQYQCMYASDLAPQGQIRGTAVLEYLGYSHRDLIQWEWMGYIVAIVAVHRLVGVGTLYWRVRSKS